MAAGEWWIGADPGPGAGTAMALTTAGVAGEIPASVPVGSHAVSVRIVDHAGNWSAVATSTLRVEGNVAPVATPATLAVDEDRTAAVTLGATDVDGPAPLTFSVRTPPAHGTLTGTAPDVVYHPAANYHGADALTFVVSDGESESAEATVTIDVRPVNDAPVATPSRVSVVSGGSVAITLTGVDADGDALTFGVAAQPTHGTLTGTPPALTYTSAAGYAGIDELRFVANDGQADSAPAIVTIEMTPPPSATVLEVASDDRRSANVRPLDGAAFTGGASAFVFVEPVAGDSVRSVSFAIDDRPFSVDSAAPYDLAGSELVPACRGCPPAALPFESNLLGLGSHRVTATITRLDGSRETSTSSFTVAATTPHSLLVSASPTRGAAKPLDGATLVGRRFLFLGPAKDPIAGVAAVVFRLDGRIVGIQPVAPYDALGSVLGIARPLDTAELGRGNHTMSATVVLLGGGTIRYDAGFRVG